MARLVVVSVGERGYIDQTSKPYDRIIIEAVSV